MLGYAAVPEQLGIAAAARADRQPRADRAGRTSSGSRPSAAWAGAARVLSGPAPVADRVRGLRGGADDWIAKPCHPEELVARIEAVLRRRRAGQAAGRGRDDRGRRARRSGPTASTPTSASQRASLSRKEYELLQLAGGVARGRVLEREDIYQRVWGYTMVRGDRSVDVFVRKLRQKLERVSPDWRYVHTHFGVGYRFAAEPAGEGAPAPGSRPRRPRSTGSHWSRGHAGPRAPCLALGGRRTLYRAMSYQRPTSAMWSIVARDRGCGRASRRAAAPTALRGHPGSSRWRSWPRSLWALSIMYREHRSRPLLTW